MIVTVQILKRDDSRNMKRFSIEHVTQTAREFAASHVARAWHMFGGEVRAALIDARVMFEIQMAHVADSEQTFTPSEIIAFRDAVVSELASGVTAAHSRQPKARYVID